MDNEKILFDFLTSKYEKRRNLEEEYYKVKENCQLLFDEELKLSGQIQEVDEKLKQGELDGNLLEEMLNVKRAKAKTFLQTFKNLDDSNCKVRVSQDVSEFTDKVKEYVKNIDCNEKNYEDNQITSNNVQYETELQLLADDMKIDSEYYNTLRDTDVSNESLKLDETLQLLDQEESKMELEKKLEDIKRQLSEYL